MALITGSCRKEEFPLDVSEIGLNYYPLQSGLFRIYEVNETRFLLNTGCLVENSESFTYYMKEAVMDSFDNLENGISYRIGRYSKEKIGDNWKLDSIWTARRDTKTAVMVENNVPFIKLSFPVEEDRAWDANSLNTREEDTYILINVKKAFIDPKTNVSYPKTVTVLQEDFDDFIVFKDQRSEVYAEDIGLVYKEFKVVEYESDDCLGDGIRNAGKEVLTHLIEYGYE